MSPRLYWEIMRQIEPAFIGEKLLQLLEWHVKREQKTFFNMGWYLRLIYRDWQSQSREAPTRPAQPMPLSLKEIMEGVSG